ncbi:MAG TPA: PepSY-associated TM helix domain-containing protein [Gammaproteobacteria bacterium]|nr:PepSY-associated TM helix domain-containing protein [Gammaproteobacteria bacterium]
MSRTRGLIVRLHRWLGFSAGTIFVLIGLSGSVLVYAPEIERQLYPALARDLPGNWRDFRPRVLERFAAGHPPGDVVLVRFPGNTYNAYQLYLRDGSQEFRDSTDGRLLARRGPLGDFVIAARTLHTELLAGAAGEQVLGWLGLAMLALLAGGIWIWLPRGGRWRNAFRRPRPMPAQRLYQSRPQLIWWHKTLGIVIVTPLLLVTLTGTALIFYGPAQALLTAAFGGQPPEIPARVAAPRASDIQWRNVFATLDRTLPRGRTVFYYPPQQAESPLLFRKRMPEELHPNGRSFIALGRDGGLLFANDASVAAAGMQATHAIYPLHSGKLGVPWYRSLVAALGVAPLVFFITGTWGWWLKRRSTKCA